MTDEAQISNPLVDITPADLDILARVEHHFIVSTPSGAEPIEALAGRALLSAVLFGGLNDPACWFEWLIAAIKARAIESHEMMWFEDDCDGKANAIWYPDPITGCYLQALRSYPRADEALQTLGEPSNLILATLRALAEGAPDVCQLQTAASKGAVWLNAVCAARLHLRIPAMLAEHAKGRTRTYPSPALAATTDDKLQQLESFLATADPKKPWTPLFADRGLAMLRESFFPNTLTEDDDRFRVWRKRMLKSLRNQINLWLETRWDHSIHRHMLFWLKSRLDTKSRSKIQHQSHIKPSTARSYLWILSTYNWSKGRTLSIMHADGVAKVQEAFKAIDEYAANRSPSQRRRFNSVLRSFSTYLNAKNSAIPIWEGRAADERRPRLPRRIVLNQQDFMELMALLDRWGASQMVSTHSEGHSAEAAEVSNARCASWNRGEACKLAAMLMFRTGLRGREVCNLALNDVSFEGGLADLVVRGSATRSNKNEFARRTLPLHALLEGDELKQLRRWHTVRCNEEFRLAPRARLFPLAAMEQLSIDQYLLEPIDAAIRLLFDGGSLGETTRKQQGYWYALASPLRHSFASHLIACLSLPDEPVKFPAPRGVSADLVSLERKRRLCDALLRSKQHGLALMQAVRYLMGHATYERALETYIHNVDWLLAVHLWRTINQLPMTEQEVGCLLKLSATKTVERPKRSDRQMRRVRAKAASNHSASSALPQMPRGRPPLALGGSGHIRSFSGTYRAFLPDELPDTVFGKDDRLAYRVLPVCKRPAYPKLEVQWLTIHNFLCLRAKGVGPAEATEQLSLEDKEICQRWAQRADELATITLKTRGHKSSADPMGAKPELRFPQLKVSDIEDPRSEAAKQQKAGGFPNPRSEAAKLIDHIWSQRAQIEKPRQWASVLSLLAGWQPEPPKLKFQSSVERRAKTYLRLGVPAKNLGVQVANGVWETYNPSTPMGSGSSKVVRLSPFEPREDGNSRGLHNTFLYALLMVLIASDKDFEVLKSSSISRKGKRLPKPLRPPQRAVVVVTSVKPE